MYANNFVEDETVRRVAVIPTNMNATAEYMAIYGMQHMTHFVETPGVFGNLHHYLDRDMGLALPMEILPNYGAGDIIDVTPPQSPVTLPEEEPMMVDEEITLEPGSNAAAIISIREIQAVDGNKPTEPTGTMEEFNMAQRKGKEKVNSELSFNEGGLLNQQAIDTIERGNLIVLSKEFGTLSIDLNKEIWLGIYVRDMLQQAVKGTLEHLRTKEANTGVIKKSLEFAAEQTYCNIPYFLELFLLLFE